MQDINQLTTHDLWVESRKISLSISRPSPTTIAVTIRRPTLDLRALDGAVLLLSDRHITPNEYPQDGDRYVASTTWEDPAADRSGSAQVIGFWSGFFAQPFPPGVADSEGMVELTVTVTGTDPDTTYYASVHGSTNVLQYYPIGVQSYPLEGSRIEKDSSSYTGSIPSLPSAPTNPQHGFVYFDQQLSLVQYWDNTRGVWVPTRVDSIPTGPVNPGIPGHAFLFTPATQVRVFDGRKWVEATATNTQLLTAGSVWTALAGVEVGTELPETPTLALLFYNFTSRTIQYWDGVTWQLPSPTTTLFNNGVAIFPAFTAPFTAEPLELVTPYAGLLFYNTSQKVLNVFDGTVWTQVNTDQQGTPSTDKMRIGNDGSYDERLRLIRVLKTQLGWPTQCVELTEDHFNVAIDNALETYRQLSVGAYERRFILFGLLYDQNKYYLNSPLDETDRIVQVQRIHRLNLLGINSATTTDNIFYQAFLAQFYSANHVDLLSLHLMSALSEEFRRIFAADLPFTWNEARRELTIHRRIHRPEKVILEVELERTEQELLLDRYCKQWLQGWALAECKETLGLIRSKYSSGTPGPAGTITLNGETLLAEARQDFTELREQLLNYEAQNAEHGNLAFWLF